MVPKVNGCSLKQPTFDWKAKDKNTELKNFEMEVTNIFLTNSYNISNAEKIPVTKNWLHFRLLTDAEQEAFSNV